MPQGVPTGPYGSGASRVSYTGHRSQNATFSLSYDLVEQITSRTPLGFDQARAVVLDEIYAFGKGVLEEVYRSMAPYKPGYSRRHLRDSIQAIRDKAALSVQLRMAWYGDLTINGRGALDPTKVYKLELPGGVVIYRRGVGAATTRAAGSDPADPDNPPPFDAIEARYRMDWAKDAYKVLQKNHYFEQLQANIGHRLLAEVFGPLYGQAEIAKWTAPNLPYRTLAFRKSNSPGEVARRAKLRNRLKLLEHRSEATKAALQRAHARNNQTLARRGRPHQQAMTSIARLQAKREAQERHYSYLTSQLSIPLGRRR